MIYLDYTAHTPADERVLSVYTDTVRACVGNANASHGAGRSAKAVMDRSLASMARMLGVAPEELILTSGASEANNLAVKGTARASRHYGKHIISTALEHSSVSGALTALMEQGWEVDLARIREDGTVDPDDVRGLIRDDTVLISVCAVDSELGTVQPVRELAAIASDHPRCRLHIDATQAVGKVPLGNVMGAENTPELPDRKESEREAAGVSALLPGVDLVTIAPHKFYGLLGSGLLIRRKDVILDPLISGGVSTSLYRSGTPDPAAAAAAEASLRLTLSEYRARSAHVAALNRKLRAFLSSHSGVRINSPDSAVPEILNLSVRGIRGDRFQEALDRHGVCVSVKSACSVRGTPSRAVMAVSHDRKNALSSWRISLSHLTTEAELDAFFKIFDECLSELTLS